LENNTIRTHKDLDVWKESILVVKDIYEISSNFPKEEIYGLTLQIRRSATSIPSNIAEGAARNTKKEFLQFLYIALGSLSELEMQLIIAKELDYLKSSSIFGDLERIKYQLIGLIRYLKNKNEK
jgi:four helix bundle protein